MSIPIEHDLILVQGCGKGFTVYWNKADGSPHDDLTEYSAELPIRAYPEAGSDLLKLTSATPTEIALYDDGKISIYINGTQSGTLTFDVAFYHLKIWPTAVSTNAVQLIRGRVILLK